MQSGRAEGAKNPTVEFQNGPARAMPVPLNVNQEKVTPSVLRGQYSSNVHQSNSTAGTLIHVTYGAIPSSG